MKLNPISNKITPSYNKKNNISFGGSYVNTGDLSNISALIDIYDSQRLDGTIQRFYQYGDYMVKAPERGTDTNAIKEFFALSRLKEADVAGVTVPDFATLARKKDKQNTSFLVEEFIKGKSASIAPYSLEDTISDLKMVSAMDKTGVINQNLSPSNIIITPDNKRVIADFNKYTFLADDGKVLYSQYVSPAYYTKKSPMADFISQDKINSDMIKSKKSVKEIFASSFLYKRKTAPDTGNLLCLKDLSSNPFLNLPSNLTNYEAKTIYPRIASMDIDNPVSFLQDYLVAKSDYHAEMRDFLKSIGEDSIKSDDSVIETVKGKLRKPSEHEDFFSFLFKNKKTSKHFTDLKAEREKLLEPLDDEAKAIYSKIADNADRPFSLMQGYFAKKSAFHSGMSERLKDIKVDDMRLGETTLDAAKEKLKSAIEYEDFLSTLFKDKNLDSCLVKFEAAKLQLQGLLESGRADEKSIHRAYQNLIRATREGFIEHKGINHRKYLKAELSKYKDAIEVLKSNKTKVKEARENLRSAIEYEDFLSTLFKDKKPDSYFAKLEAAKIQLHGLLNRGADKGEYSKKHLPAAYQKLIAVIEEGLGVYNEPKYQKYLKIELARYQDAFKGTKFGSIRPKQPISKTFDILDSYFGGVSLPFEESILPKRAQNVEEAVKSAIKAPLITKDTEYAFQDAVDTVANHAKKYSKQDYIKMGGKYFARLGILLLAGGLLLNEIIQYKNEDNANKNK